MASPTQVASRLKHPTAWLRALDSCSTIFFPMCTSQPTTTRGKGLVWSSLLVCVCVCVRGQQCEQCTGKSPGFGLSMVASSTTGVLLSADRLELVALCSRCALAEACVSSSCRAAEPSELPEDLGSAVSKRLCEEIAQVPDHMPVCLLCVCILCVPSC